MKIMQVIPYFCFGGAETMCENLTYALKAMGHEVTVVSLLTEHTPISERMEKAGIRILYLDKKLGLDLSMFSKLTRLMRTEKPDVVHTHLNVIKYAALCAKLAGVPRCIHTVHNVAREEAEGRLQKITNWIYFHSGCSVPVALSPEIKNSIVSYYAMKPEAVPVICNGIDLSHCIPKEQYRERASRILHIGRFNEQKNHRGLLDAFAQVVTEHPGCRLELLGDGELKSEMEEYAQKLGISGSVFFRGSQTDVYPYLNQADIFLLPSKYEGMPMTIIEAMGTGLPVVATAVGGVPDMIVSGESGLLVPCEVAEVARAVGQLVTDKALCARLGGKARQESRRFSAEHMAERYCAVYRGEGEVL